MNKKRKKKKKLKRVKNGSKPMGSRELQRQKKREDEYKQIVKNLEDLGTSNPYDEMDMETKRKHTLSLFYEKIKVEFLVYLKNCMVYSM